MVGRSVKGELHLSVLFGKPADEAVSNARLSIYVEELKNVWEPQVA